MKAAETFEFECSRCDSFGRFSVNENPRCECDETEDRLTADRDAYRAMLCDLLASAHPHPTEHPAMAKQWALASF